MPYPPVALPSLLEALIATRHGLRQRIDELHACVDAEAARVTAQLDLHVDRILSDPQHPDSPSDDVDDGQRHLVALRAAGPYVDDDALRRARADVDDLVEHGRVLERAIVDHLAHAGISDPIAVAAALLAHRGDPYPIARDLLELELERAAR